MFVRFRQLNERRRVDPEINDKSTGAFGTQQINLSVSELS